MNKQAVSSNKFNVYVLTGTAICIALALVLPQAFHMVGLGYVFLPMHLPVFLCGLVFGGWGGLVCGVVAPLLSSLLTGMPPLFPQGLSMCFELAAYGLCAGYLYRQRKSNIFVAIIGSMIVGRLVYLVAKAILLFGSGTLAKELWIAISGSVVGFSKALPGIILQLVLLPLIVAGLNKTGLGTRE